VGSTDDEFTMLTDRVKNKLRLVPASFALGLLGVPSGTRAAYLRDNAAQRRKGTAAVLGRYATDAVFRAGVVRVAEARAHAATWVYRFEWPSPVIGWACHCLDVPFWFDCLDAGVGALAGDHPPRALAAAVHGSAVAFARDGEPGWPAWSTMPGSTRIFGGEPSRPDVTADGYASVRALV
jgi:para-nitrobenzyl esterase